MSQEHQPQSPQPTPEKEPLQETAAAPAGEAAQSPASQEPSPAPAGKDTPPADKPGNKPVVVYIMILFIAAFLLMALSFFMHQRSNTEVIGELQHSVTAMQEVQAAQEKIIELQEEMDTAKDQQAELQAELNEAQETLEDANSKLAALTNLYLLVGAYRSEDYDSCQQIIDQMESEGQGDLLTIDSSLEGVVFPSFYNSPDLVYDNIKEAVANRPGE